MRNILLMVAVLSVNSIVPASLRAPPEALLTVGDLPVAEVHPHIGIQQPKTADRGYRYGGRIRRTVSLLIKLSAAGESDGAEDH